MSDDSRVTKSRVKIIGKSPRVTYSLLGEPTGDRWIFLVQDQHCGQQAHVLTSLWLYNVLQSLACYKSWQSVQQKVLAKYPENSRSSCITLRVFTAISATCYWKCCLKHRIRTISWENTMFWDYVLIHVYLLRFVEIIPCRWNLDGDWIPLAT